MLPVEADDNDNTEEETVVRMDRLDPEPELDQFEETAEITLCGKPGEQAAASQVDVRTPLKAIHPCQSPSNIISTAERRGQASGLPPERSSVSTPPGTPVQEAELTSSNYDRYSANGCSATPTSTRDVNPRGTIMTPPATPSLPVGDKSRGEPKWRTKLGTALEVVLGNVPIVQQVDRVKAKLKMAPKDKQLVVEYDTCVAQVSVQSSKPAVMRNVTSSEE
ncbi:Hypp2219 [Branchiostoma lanceolatum]|uniref:Hypp2219 protein n=1 Tax=Branchiostoma lanceolatum TaxID=7740 RepID=A0A8J9ZS24_BRALA|nr:Hypp2219 [Branchiostoma lanceolatum]